MISRVIKKTVDLDAVQKVDQLEGPLYQLEESGHTFEITCMSGGTAAAVSGAVSGRFLRADETTVYFTGTLSGNVASITLPQSCYNVNGRFGFVVFVSGSNVTSAIYAVAGNVYRSTSETIIDPTGEIPSLEELMAEIEACEEATASAQQAASFVNSIIAPTYSTGVSYAIGDYCTYEGSMYRAIAATSGEFDPSDWEMVLVGGEFERVDGEVSDLKSAVGDFEDAISQTGIIKSSNLFDIANATTGYYWSSGHVDSTSYNNTGFIEVEEGKTFTYQYGTKEVSNNRLIASMRFIAAYDENKNYVSSASKTAQTSYTVPNGIKYVILGIASGYLTLNNSQWSAVVYSTEVVPYEDYIVPYTKTEIKVDALPSIVRRHAYILATDTESEILEKLVDAYNFGNTDVFFERADYSFGDGLASVATTYNLTSNEIPIGNGCRYFFNGSTLTATLDLDNLGDDEFYCNFFGCQRVPSSYEMYDGVLVATDTRYIVHDEASALSGTYKHIYQNMEMHYHTESRQEAIRKCIGGGTGADGVVEIIGCKFTTDGTDSCVSYHGNGTDVVGAKFDLNIRNSWFSNNVRGGTLSQNQTARLFYTGNSAMGNPTTYDRWTVTAFLNEVRS